jgi:hypothetical protein
MGNTTKGRPHLAPYVWKPGQSGNPNGREKGGTKYFRKVSPACLERIADALFHGTVDDLEVLFNAKDVTPIEKLAISCAKTAYQKGDTLAMQMFLDRFVGKVPDKLKVQPVAQAETLEALTDDELMRRATLLDEAE